MAGGHITDVPTYMTYYSGVIRDIVFIGFPVADLNNLDILASDIQNDFLEDPTKEKILFYAQYERKDDRDKVFIFVREIYVLKYSALQFRNFLVETLVNRLG